MTYIGIDYSMTSPGIAIVQDHNVFLYALYKETHEHLTMQLDKLWSIKVVPNPSLGMIGIKRYDTLAKYVMTIIGWHTGSEEKKVGIEDYAFAARGKVFHIAENTAILKYYLSKEFDYVTVEPTVIKKHAYKGNAKKEDMYAAFMTKTGIDIRKEFDITRKLNSPETDLVDAFWLADYLQHGE